jgi:hypothetical protein
MGRLGLTELSILLVVGLVPFGLAFMFGFFVGKSVGLKEGLREAGRLNRPQ